jgi:PAS domain S-box-containing protein
LALAALAARLAVDPLIGDAAPYTLFILAVLFAAVRLGTGPAVLTTALSAIVATRLFVPPRDGWVLTQDRLTYAIAFCAISGGVLLFSRRLSLRQSQLEVREEKLAHEAREQRLIDAAQDYAIYELDREGHILTWNKGAERLKGWKAEEIIGKPYNVLHTPESRAKNAPGRELKIAAETGRFEEEAPRMRKDGTIFAAHVSLFPLRDENGDVTGYVKVTRDVSDRSKDGRAMLESRRRMEAIVQSAMDGIISFDEEQRILLFNPAAEKVFGYSSDDILGRQLATLFPEQVREKLIEDVRQFFATGVVNQSLEGTDLVAERRGGEEFPIDASMSQVSVSGERVGTMILRDVTERRTNEEARALLAREVDHRAKNALAVAQALVTLTKAGTVEDFSEAIRGRIESLGRAHSLLSQSQWRGAPLEQLIRDELGPYAKDEQLQINGERISCGASAVQSLSLLFHELATNAVKHGALGRDTGKVMIEWFLDSRQLKVTWKERGGPPVSAPKGEGFGSRLLRQVAGRQLDADLKFHWDTEGLCVDIGLPADLFMPGDLKVPHDLLEAAESSAPARHASQQRSILLVEDEELVALELSVELSRLGWAVVGPAATLAEAQALLSRHVDAAVLDVNIRGRSVYPVAEQLAKRQVPFVFCTGYEMVDPEGRFPDVPVIRKPAHPAAVSAALADLLRATAN